MTQGTRVAKKQNQIGEFSETIKCLMELMKGKGAYKTIQAFLHSNNIDVSIGAIVRWCKDNIPEYVEERLTYGKGNKVIVGRTLRTEFTLKDTDEVYVKLATKWVKEYASMFTDVLREENNSDLVVHHIDGDHTNNDRKNLKIMTRSEHSSYHSKKFWAEKKAGVK